MGADLWEAVRRGQAVDPGANHAKQRNHHRVHFYRLITPGADTISGDAARALIRCSCGTRSEHSFGLARKYYLSQESFENICPSGGKGLKKYRRKK